MDREFVKENIDNVKIVINRYKNDLIKTSDALKEYDSIDKELHYKYQLSSLEEQYKSVLGYTEKDIRLHLQLVSQPATLDKKKRYTLKELFDEYTSDASWLASRIFQKAGMYLLCGEAKTGKSLTVYDLIYSIVVSGSFLGMPCKRGKVILYQCEEAGITVKNRLKSRGIDPTSDNSAIKDLFNSDKLIINREFDLKNDIDKLKEEIAEVQPVLVILDSLTSISTNIEEPMENAEFVRRYMYPLQRMFIMNETCGLVLHHLNKQPAGKSNSKLARIGGSSRLPAATDGLVFLEHEVPGRPNGKVVLSTVPRDGFPIELLIEKCREEGGGWHFEVLEERGVDPDVVECGYKILRRLAKDTSAGMNKVVLAKELGQSVAVVQAALERLTEGQIITCTRSNKEFIYSVPKDDFWKEHIELMSNEDEPLGVTETFINYPAQVADIFTAVTTIEELNLAFSVTDEEIKIKAWTYLTPEEKKRLLGLAIHRLQTCTSHQQLMHNSVTWFEDFKKEVMQSLPEQDLVRLIRLKEEVVNF